MSDTVTTVGSGTAAVRPDGVRLVLTVEATADSVVRAYETVGQRVGAVTEALRGDGVADRDIQTTNLSVHTNTAYDAVQGNRIVGYTASSSLTVGLTSEAEVATTEVIKHCVAAGGDEIRLGGLQQTIADPQEVAERARQAAWEDALRKARQYAQCAGRQVGTVVNIVERQGNSGPTVVRDIALAGSPAGVPIESGVADFHASVEVTWELL